MPGRFDLGSSLKSSASNSCSRASTRIPSTPRCIQNLTTSCQHHPLQTVAAIIINFKPLLPSSSTSNRKMTEPILAVGKAAYFAQNYIRLWKIKKEIYRRSVNTFEDGGKIQWSCSLACPFMFIRINAYRLYVHTDSLQLCRTLFLLNTFSCAFLFKAILAERLPFAFCFLQYLQNTVLSLTLSLPRCFKKKNSQKFVVAWRRFSACCTFIQIHFFLLLQSDLC